MGFNTENSTQDVENDVDVSAEECTEFTPNTGKGKAYVVNENDAVVTAEECAEFPPNTGKGASVVNVVLQQGTSQSKGTMELLKSMSHRNVNVLEELSPSDFPSYQHVDLASLPTDTPEQKEEFSEIHKWLDSGTKIDLPPRWDVASRKPQRKPFDFLASFQTSIPRSIPEAKPSTVSILPRVESSHMKHQEISIVGSCKPSDDLSSVMTHD